MTGYTETILEYAADDRWVGILADADGTGEVGLDAEDVGRRLAVRFTLRSRNGLVNAVRFQVFGCGFTIAACAVASELTEGRSLDAALALDAEAVNTALGGLPEERSYCAELAVEALHAAVQSARNGAAVQISIHPPDTTEHAPRVRANDPLYRALIDSPCPFGVSNKDRHLFACLITVTTQETSEVDKVLGLGADEVATILDIWFPQFDRLQLTQPVPPLAEPASEMDNEVLAILLPHVPKDPQGKPVPTAFWLARILAARAAQPGHLWVAMGLFERTELTASIRRHLPSLAAANNQGMRWKRYLFKQICDQGGGMMCKSPNCGICSDYALCFAPD